MENIGIFYGSTVGTTERIVKTIKRNFSCKMFEIEENYNKINDFDKIILATSTWGQGELQENFLNVLDEIKNIDFTGKKVALLGVGDQQRYSDTFVNGLSILKKIILNNNGTIIGYTNLDSYHFENSNVVEKDKLIGLAIDQVSQKHLTEERILNWCEQLRLEF